MIHRHHVLFDKAAWSSSDYRKDLRNCQWLIPPILETEHRLLHQAVEGVPLPDFILMGRIRREFSPVIGNYLMTMNNFMMATEEALRNPKTTELQQALGQLTVQAVDIQIPFVREGLEYRRAA